MANERSVASAARVDNGECTIGDAVLFFLDCVLCVGELLLLFDAGTPSAIVSKWSAMPSDDGSMLRSFVRCDDAVMVELSAVSGPLTHRVSDDRSVSAAIIPLEFR